MRVFAVAQAHLERQRDEEGPGGRLRAIEVVGNCLVIFGSGQKALDGKLLAEFKRRASVVLLHLSKDCLVIPGIGDDCHRLVVFCGASKHGRATDINLLECFFQGHSGPLRRRLEGVQVHDNEIDRFDLVGLGLALVLGVFAQIKQAAMHFGVERFDTAIQDFREAGELLDRNMGNRFAFEQGGGASGRNDLHPELA
jgi:hypothetical protein